MLEPRARASDLLSYTRSLTATAAGAMIGTLGLGITGALVGLAVGISVHAGTAIFAAFELGAPAALLGAIVGSSAGAIVAGIARARGRRHPA